MEKMAINVLSCCVDKSLLENDPVTYLKGNNKLAHEVVDFLDGVKENIQNHVCVNFTHLDNQAVPLDESEYTDNGCLIDRDVGESNFSQKYRTAITILSDTTKRGYGRILADLKDQFGLQQLPSYFQLTANRPSMVDLSISPLPTHVKKELLLNIASEIGVEIDEEEALMSTGCGGEMLKGGKVKGDYAWYIEMMAL